MNQTTESIERLLASTYIILLASVMYSCQASEPDSLADRYAELTKSVVNLTAATNELQGDNQALRAAIQRTEKERDEWKERTEESEATVLRLRSALQQVENEREEWRDRAGELEGVVLRLQPESLPAFSTSDLEKNELVLRRVFSVRTGRCFSQAGASSCLFLKLQEAEGGGYVVYKANRIFLDVSTTPPLFNTRGGRLSLVTREVADVIQSWESENPHNSIRVGAY